MGVCTQCGDGACIQCLCIIHIGQDLKNGTTNNAVVFVLMSVLCYDGYWFWQCQNLMLVCSL